MVGIEGLGIPPLRANPTETESGRVRREAAPPALVQDGAQFSEEAREAAEVARLRELAGERAEELRQERIEAAKQDIEKGTYRLYDVVTLVASRVSKYASL